MNPLTADPIIADMAEEIGLGDMEEIEELPEDAFAEYRNRGGTADCTPDDVAAAIRAVAFAAPVVVDVEEAEEGWRLVARVSGETIPVSRTFTYRETAAKCVNYARDVLGRRMANTGEDARTLARAMWIR